MIGMIKAYALSGSFSADYKHYASLVAQCCNNSEGGCEGKESHFKLLSKAVFCLIGTVESFLNEFYIYHYSCSYAHLAQDDSVAKVMSIETFGELDLSKKIKIVFDILSIDFDKKYLELYNLRTKALHFYPLYSEDDVDCEAACKFIEVNKIDNCSKIVFEIISTIRIRIEELGVEAICIYPGGATADELFKIGDYKSNLSIHICDHNKK